MYVAVADDQVVGFVSVAERTHFTGQVDAYVGELVTATGMERRGIARALMTVAEAWGADCGLRCLTLETGAANQTARSFYASLGYLPEDVRLTKLRRSVSHSPWVLGRPAADRSRSTCTGSPPMADPWTGTPGRS